ncbi:hypothetical protein, partial [Tritonibacter sp. SIMBA_163]|uniref:hypothetical protein n=1 Tax=Tritonibacter sp. SIMBA_163 TaxID=3080868 RepID=UPI0039803744
DNAKMAVSSLNNLKKCFEEMSPLRASRNIREDRGHLELSLLTAMWNTSIYVNDHDVFLFAVDKLLSGEHYKNSPLKAAAAINKSK